MHFEKRRYTWADGKTLTIGERPLIMGILNITADSFSDGGCWNTPERALQHMRQMIADGADIIDVGAESTRPGYCTALGEEEEISRLEKILPLLLQHTTVPISVDTYKAKTAAYAMAAGSHILNDIWGLQYVREPGEMAAVAAAYNVPIIVMHNQETTVYRDLLSDMQHFFTRTMAIAAHAGIDESCIITDPGLGLFGKTTEQNLYIMQHLETFTRLPYPLLLGPSRKRFIGAVLDLPVQERMEGTGAVCVAGVLAGAAILRVHDVRPAARMCRMAAALRRQE